MFVGGGRGPALRRVLEEPGEWLGSKTVTGLHNGAAADRLAITIGTGQHQIEMAHDLLDRPVAQQTHPEHEPYDVFGGKLAPPHAGLVRGLKRPLDPLGIEGLGKEREARLSPSLAGVPRPKASKRWVRKK